MPSSRFARAFTTSLALTLAMHRAAFAQITVAPVAGKGAQSGLDQAQQSLALWANARTFVGTNPETELAVASMKAPIHIQRCRVQQITAESLTCTMAHHRMHTFQRSEVAAIIQPRKYNPFEPALETAAGGGALVALGFSSRSTPSRVLGIIVGTPLIIVSPVAILPGLFHWDDGYPIYIAPDPTIHLTGRHKPSKGLTRADG